MKTRVLKEQNKSGHDELAKQKNPAIEHLEQETLNNESLLTYANHITIADPKAKEGMRLFVHVDGVIEIVMKHREYQVHVNDNKKAYNEAIQNSRLSREQTAIMHLDIETQRLVAPEVRSRADAEAMLHRGVVENLAARGINVQPNEVTLLGSEVVS